MQKKKEVILEQRFSTLSPAWYILHGRKLVEYDVVQDEYFTLTAFPTLNQSSEAATPIYTGGYGAGEGIELNIPDLNLPALLLHDWEEENADLDLYIPYQFSTKDFNSFYVIGARDARGDATFRFRFW